ncbi:hypothetical protein MT418_000575 [Batrachochytrium dendrobatidis]
MQQESKPIQATLGSLNKNTQPSTDSHLDTQSVAHFMSGNDQLQDMSQDHPPNQALELDQTNIALQQSIMKPTDQYHSQLAMQQVSAYPFKPQYYQDQQQYYPYPVPQTSHYPYLFPYFQPHQPYAVQDSYQPGLVHQDPYQHMYSQSVPQLNQLQVQESEYQNDRVWMSNPHGFHSSSHGINSDLWAQDTLPSESWLNCGNTRALPLECPSTQSRKHYSQSSVSRSHPSLKAVSSKGYMSRHSYNPMTSTSYHPNFQPLSTSTLNKSVQQISMSAATYPHSSMSVATYPRSSDTLENITQPQPSQTNLYNPTRQHPSQAAVHPTDPYYTQYQLQPMQESEQQSGQQYGQQYGQQPVLDPQLQESAYSSTPGLAGNNRQSQQPYQQEQGTMRASTQNVPYQSDPVVVTLDNQSSNQNPSKLDPYPPFDTKQPKQRICCCFRTYSCCVSCFCCCFIVLIALGLTIFFLWPKIPTVSMSDPYIPIGSTGLQVSSGDISTAGITNGLKSASASNPYSFSFPFATNVSAISTNKIDILLDTVVFNSILLSKADTTLPNIHADSTLEHVNIRKNAETIIVVPYRLTYSTSAPVDPSTDPALSLLMESCKSRAPLRMSYSVTLYLRLVSWTGYHPTTSGTFSIACPSSIANLLGSISN